MKQTTLLPLILLCGCVLLLSGCSTTQTEDNEIAEIPTSGATLVDTPQHELFEQAKRQYESGLYLISRDSWESLVQGYPVGPYAEYAEIKAADCLFSLREFNEALGEYESILKNRPGSPALDYVLLRAGRSSQLANRGAGRDLSPLEKSIELYERLISEYPKSTYIEAAKRYLVSAKATVADHHQMILAYYDKQEHTEAFESRKREYDSTWGADQMKRDKEQPNIIHAGRTLLPKSAPKVVAMAMRSGARASSGFGSEPPVLRQAIRISEPNSDEDPSPVELAIDSEQDESNYVRQVRCFDDGAPTVQIHLQRPLSSTLPSQLIPDGGKLTLQLPVQLDSEKSFDCFGENNLNVATNGLMSFPSERNADVFALSRPPRIILVLKR